MKKLLLLVLFLLYAATAVADTGTLRWTHPRDAGLTSFKYSINGGAQVDIGLPAQNEVQLTVNPGDVIRLWACYGANCRPTSTEASVSLTIPGAPPPPPPPGTTRIHKGRWKDGGTRALPVKLTMAGHYSTWGPAACETAARAAGYVAGDFVAMQATEQCWVGKKDVNDPYRYGQPVPLGTSNQCRDGSGAFCGSDWVNDVFELQ